MAGEQPSGIRCAEGYQKQADPLSKDGLIGAFNRTYTVTQAIDKFIPDVYRHSRAIPGRYDYIPADSAAGVVVYDDLFVYSHHATDPCCGKLMNAFDVVRLHKFGDKDARAAKGTEPENALLLKPCRILFLQMKK